MPIYILEPTTDGANSDAFSVSTRPGSVIQGKLQGMPVHIAVFGLAGSEKATLQQRDPAGNWFDYADENGKVEFTATRRNVAIFVPGVFRIQKGATAQAVGAQVSTEIQP